MAGASTLVPPLFSWPHSLPFPEKSPPPMISPKASKKTHKPDSLMPPRRAERTRIPGPLLKKTRKLDAQVSPHRAVAAVRLLRIEQGGAFADLLNEKGRDAGEKEMDYVERTLGFRTRDLDDRDIRLVTDIVGGAVRWRRYLDHLIVSVCHEDRTFRDMEPLLLQILRIGFYEILKLGMPPYAVVDENVRLAKVSLRSGAGNLVNGILRTLVLLKDNDSLPLPKIEGDVRAQARALAIVHSHPVWMVRRWTKFLGQEEAVRLMNWNNSDPTFSLRVNTGKVYTRTDLVTKLDSLKVPYELSTYLDDFVRIRTGMQTVIQAGLLKEGLCSVQDESAGGQVHRVFLSCAHHRGTGKKLVSKEKRRFEASSSSSPPLPAPAPRSSSPPLQPQLPAPAPRSPPASSHVAPINAHHCPDRTISGSDLEQI